MTPPAVVAADPVATTPRTALRELAAAAVRADPGVVRIVDDGIRVAALAEAGYSVDVSVVVRPQPLHPLADRLRGAVAQAAAQAGLAAELGPVGVAFVDVEEAAA